MKRLVIGVLVGLAVTAAAPATAAPVAKQFAPSEPRAVTLAERYLPKGDIVKWRWATRRVLHVQLIEAVTPKNNIVPFVDGIPEGAVWDTIYTLRFGKRQVLQCIGGLGVVKRFPR